MKKTVSLALMNAHDIKLKKALIMRILSYLLMLSIILSFASCASSEKRIELIEIPDPPPVNKEEFSINIHTTVAEEDLDQILGKGKYEEYISLGFASPYPCYVLETDDFISAYADGTSFRDMISKAYRVLFPKGSLADAYYKENGKWKIDDKRPYFDNIPTEDVNKFISEATEEIHDIASIIYIALPSNTRTCSPVQNLQLIYVVASCGEYIIPCENTPVSSFQGTVYTVDDFMAEVINLHNNFLKTLSPSGEMLYG